MNDTNDETFHGVSIELPPTPVSIAVARAAIRRAVAFRSDDARSALLIAVTEILGNAIDEHIRLKSRDTITLNVESGHRDVIRIIDHGAGFRIEESIEVDDSLEMSERGRGIVLARAFVPTMQLDSGQDGTAAVLPLEGLGIVR